MLESRDMDVAPDLERLGEVRDFAGGAAEAFGFEGETVQEVRLAASEAVANAIEHGEPPVHVRACEEAGALVFYVTDGGHFVPRVTRNSPFPERGRGFAFMSGLMDEVSLNPQRTGTELRLEKRRA